MTGVVGDPRPDDVEVDAEELVLEATELVVVEVAAVPGIVEALTTLSTPTPAAAAKATPAVSRLSLR